MTETTDTRANITRHTILRAAVHQFAQKPYHQVGLDDVLAEAGSTKGAMYFHFRSKQDLAMAIIDEQMNVNIAAVETLVKRNLSGLETLIDIAYQTAVRDVGEDAARAGIYLLEALGRINGLQATLVDQWTRLLASIVERGIAEGDILEHCEPHDVGRLLVLLYMGVRQTSDLDSGEQFLLDFEKNFTLVLPAVVQPRRLDYFRQFISRRTVLAIRTVNAASGLD